MQHFTLKPVIVGRIIADTSGSILIKLSSIFIMNLLLWFPDVYPVL